MPDVGSGPRTKEVQSDARSMALECGELMHQVFAAVRIWQLSKVQKRLTCSGDRQRIFKSADGMPAGTVV